MPERQLGRAQRARAYGSHLAGCFGLPEPRFHVARTLRRGLLSLSEIDLTVPMTEPSAPLGYDEAYLVTVHLKNVARHEYWLNGRALNAAPRQAGFTYINNLNDDPRALLREPAHTVHFFMPFATLTAFAEEHGAAPDPRLIYEPGGGQDDPVMRHLAQAALAALSGPQRDDGLFLDQLLYSACARMIERYGSRWPRELRSHGGLSPRQQGLAKELMASGSDVSIAGLARECGLSVTHFIRAFRESTGTSPHQWLQRHRVETAMSLLASSKLTLTEVALTCGFCSQAHLNRVFLARVGTTPGRWRREHGDGTAEE